MNYDYHSSWSKDGQAVVERAIVRHGGREAWDQAGAFHIAPVSFSGIVPYIKGFRRSLGMSFRFEIHPRERRTVLHDFPRAGLYGVFSQGDVALYDADKPAVPLAIRQAARSMFSGLSKYRFWQPIDWLYFFGYASTCYFSYPFVFPSFELLGLSRMVDEGEALDALTLRFPPYFDSHCPVQTFCFDQTGLLRRNDYYASIIGRWGMAAHYLLDYREINGVKVALHRYVRARLGALVLPVTALDMAFDTVDAHLGELANESAPCAGVTLHTLP